MSWLIVAAQLWALGGLVTMLWRATCGHDDHMGKSVAVYFLWPFYLLSFGLRR